MAPSRALSCVSDILRLLSVPPANTLSRVQRHALRKNVCSLRSPLYFRRCLSTTQALRTEPSKDPQPPDYLSEGELKVFKKIKIALQPSTLEVQDISGGCGSMYALEVVSDKFSGLPVIKQHKLVNQILSEEIKSWHGIQLKTRAK